MSCMEKYTNSMAQLQRECRFRFTFPSRHVTTIYKANGFTIFLNRTAYASFGGLLMALTGAYRHVSNITVGDNVYLLARK